MEINNKKIKSIRPMTDDEKTKYTRNRDPLINNNNIFCIELDDGTIHFPYGNCLSCILENKCLFSLI